MELRIANAFKTGKSCELKASIIAPPKPGISKKLSSYAIFGRTILLLSKSSSWKLDLPKRMFPESNCETPTSVTTRLKFPS